MSALESNNSNRPVLHIQPLSKEVEEMYSHHGTFHQGDSGLDLFIIQDATIKAGETAFLNLGIRCAAYSKDNQNTSWLIMPRSSISKTPLRLSNSVGLIDAGYRGEIIACLDNIKSVDYTVHQGDRLLQAVYPDLRPFDMKIVDQLSQTSRGEGGFGSTTGKKIPQAFSAVTNGGSVVDNGNPPVISEATTDTNETAVVGKPKESGGESENKDPTIAKPSGNRKRNSDIELESPDRVKRLRGDSADEAAQARD